MPGLWELSRPSQSVGIVLTINRGGKPTLQMGDIISWAGPWTVVSRESQLSGQQSAMLIFLCS